MKSIKIAAIIVILVILGGWGLLKGLTQFVPVGITGVRIQQYSILGKKGVVLKDFAPGWHRDLGPLDSWVLYDSTVHTLEMTKDPRHGSTAGRDELMVQSVDGNHISLDVTVKYRIMADKAHLLYQNTGKGTKYMTVVRIDAENACMGFFGQMQTEDFYNPDVKRDAAEKVKVALQAALADNYIEVIDILIRNLEFDPKYEQEIRRKKLADQEVELNKSLGEAEKMRGITQVIEAETEKLVNIIVKEKEAELVTMQAQTTLDIAKIEAAYEKYATERKADADLIIAQRGAEGEKLVKQAEAEGERLRNDALAGVGGSYIAALEAARNLNLKDVTISTVDIDVLDVDAMAKRLGAE